MLLNLSGFRDNRRANAGSHTAVVLSSFWLAERLSGRSRLLRENMTLAEHCLTLTEAGYLAYTIDLIS